MTVKLQCNVSDETAAIFTNMIDNYGISTTEGIRRAIAVWAFLERELDAGNKIAAVALDGTVREIRILNRSST